MQLPSISRPCTIDINDFFHSHWLSIDELLNFLQLHSKQLVDLFESHGIEVYNGSGKTVGEHPDGYPPRSHDCMPAETHFANIFHRAQCDLTEKERKRSRSRSMMMWKNSLDYTWDNCPLEEIQKLIDRQPMIMEKIIEVDGARTRFWRELHLGVLGDFRIDWGPFCINIHR